MKLKGDKGHWSFNTLHAEMMSRGDAPTRNYFHHVNTEMATLKLLRVLGNWKSREREAEMGTGTGNGNGIHGKGSPKVRMRMEL